MLCSLAGREGGKEREKDKGVNKKEIDFALSSHNSLFFLLLLRPLFPFNPSQKKKKKKHAAPDLVALRRLQGARLLPLPRLRVRGCSRADQGDKGEAAAVMRGLFLPLLLLFSWAATESRAGVGKKCFFRAGAASRPSCPARPQRYILR